MSELNPIILRDYFIRLENLKNWVCPIEYDVDKAYAAYLEKK